MLARIRHRLVMLGLAGLLLTGTAFIVPPHTAIAAAHDRYHETSFNDEYVFAATRGLSDSDSIHPALKVTLFPVTILLDTVFLPFAVIAGFIA